MLIFLSTSRSEMFLRGEKPKFVTCEECVTEYVYVIERQAACKDDSLFSWSSAQSERKAVANGEKLLEKELAKGVDVVPCPECGHIQANMVVVAKLAMFRWVNFAAFVLSIPGIFASFILFGLSLSFSNTMAGLLEFAAILCVPSIWVSIHAMRLIGMAVYDPNSAPEDRRIARGQKLAMFRHEWEAERARELERLRNAPLWGEPTPIEA